MGAGGRLDIDGEAASDMSGYSVSMSNDGTTVAIGSRGGDGNGSSAGLVRIYQFENDSWLQVGDDIDGEAADDSSGMSVSMSSDGNTVAIGARYNDDNGSNAGHVRVYQLNGMALGCRWAIGHRWGGNLMTAPAIAFR